MKLILSIAFGLTFSGHVIAQTAEKYSSGELVEDLDYLYVTLQETHYNLFVNTPQTEYQKAYEKLRLSLQDSLDLLNVYRKFQPFVALSELGHCALDYPFGRLYGNYIQNGGKVFPLNIFIEENSAYVIGNYSENVSISKGDELVSINEIPVQEILDNIYNYLSGDSEYLKNTLLDMITFPRMLWILSETSDSYTISVRDTDGVIKEYLVHSITAADFENQVINEPRIFHSDRQFKIIDGIAYIKPGPFMNAEGSGNTSDVETFETGEFMQFIDSAFSEIVKGGYDKLIIDLRYNAGGSNTFSDEMITYIADKPFKFSSKFEVKTSKITKDFWEQVEDTTLAELKKQILSHSDGEKFISEIPYREPKADSIRFKGKVYALINRYSYSQATLTAAMIKDYGFGELIGETTSDVPTNYASIHQFELPNTKINVSYPKALIVRPNGDMELKGTEPDIEVKENIFTDTDEILEFAIDYIINDE